MSQPNAKGKNKGGGGRQSNGVAGVRQAQQQQQGGGGGGAHKVPPVPAVGPSHGLSGVFSTPSSSTPAATSASVPPKIISDENNIVPESDFGKESSYIDDEEEDEEASRDSDGSELTSIQSLPENVLENIFTFLPLEDTLSASLTNSRWNRVLRDANGDVWRSLCLQKMDRETLNSELLSSCPTFWSKLRAYYHAWNPHDTSRNVYVKPNHFTIHRNPVAQSTDGARAKIGFVRGRHAWEVKWEGPLGTVAVVGVATRDADLRSQGYIALLGKDDQSWGWNLVENVLLNNGDSQGNYPLVNNAPRYQIGERIRVILDCEDNTLSFEKNEEFLGVAFRGLPPREPLFPAVSAVYGNSEISMVYLGPPLDG